MSPLGNPSGSWRLAQPQCLLDGVNSVLGQIGDVGDGAVHDFAIKAEGLADGDGAVGVAGALEAIGFDVHTGHYTMNNNLVKYNYYQLLHFKVQATI